MINLNTKKALSAMILASMLTLGTGLAADTNYCAPAKAEQFTPLQGKVIYVPSGTSFPATATMELSSESLELGQSVCIALSQDFYYNNTLVAPIGSSVNGTVIQVKKAGRAGINGQLMVKFTNIITPYGQMIPISGKIQTEDGSGLIKGGTKLESATEYAKDILETSKDWSSNRTDLDISNDQIDNGTNTDLGLTSAYHELLSMTPEERAKTSVILMSDGEPYCYCVDGTYVDDKHYTVGYNDETIEDLKAQITKLEVKKTKTEEDITDIINKMWEEYQLTPNNVKGYQKPENIALTQRKVNELRTDIRELGSVNVDSIEEYKNLKERYDFMCEQRLDLENTMSKLRKIIQEMLETMKQQFKEKFEIINKNFGEVFKELFGGGMAEVSLTDEENILECGIDITVQPPGKKLQNMTLLSGGEKAFTAIALLFAILKINPAPFCVLDEIEAALDDVNVYRYAEYLKKFSKETQFLIITHRKGTMEAADTVYGVTMEEKGISKLLSMKLKQ